MSVRTYNPSDVIMIVGGVPILEWESLTIEKPEQQVLIKGLSNEFKRFYLKNSEIYQILLTIPTISEVANALDVLSFSDVPFPIALTNIQQENFNTILPAVLSTDFYWPCIFYNNQSPNYGRTNSTRIFHMIGVHRI